MEKAKKDLRVYSLLILIVTAISLVKIIVDVITNGIPQPTEIPAGYTKEAVQVIATVAFVISLLLFFPEIYVGFKGLGIAKGDAVKGSFMLITLILTVVFAVSTISGFLEMTKAFSLSTVLKFLDPAIETLLFVYVYITARKIAKN